MRFFTLIALLIVMFLVIPVRANDLPAEASAQAGWHFGVGMEGLTPSTFVIEKDIGKCKLSPSFEFVNLEKVNFGFDFLYPIEPVYLSVGYEYAKWDESSSSVVPFGIAYYHKFDWFTVKIFTSSYLDLNEKSLALTNTKLSWFIFF